MTGRMQIGEVAERTGLSQRTIRYYGEVGLVPPSSRTEGGFRLFTEDDVATLELIKKMKPLGYSLEEMRDVLDLIAELERDPTPGRGDDVTERLAAIRATAASRRDKLAAYLAGAEAFLDELDHYMPGPTPPSERHG